MEQREKLIELLAPTQLTYEEAVYMADYLLANGVVVLPCRCGECEYSEKCGVERWCNEHQIPMGNDDFCPYGKRKGGDE